MAFIFSDYIALIAALLLIAAIVLFVVLLKNILQKTPTEVEETETTEEAKQYIEEKNTEIPILEAYLESISKDISEIKRKLDKLEISPTAEENSELKKQLQKINLKLDAIYNVLSDIGKE